MTDYEQFIQDFVDKFKQETNLNRDLIEALAKSLSKDIVGKVSAKPVLPIEQKTEEPVPNKTVPPAPLQQPTKPLIDKDLEKTIKVNLPLIATSISSLKSSFDKLPISIQSSFANLKKELDDIEFPSNDSVVAAVKGLKLPEIPSIDPIIKVINDFQKDTLEQIQSIKFPETENPEIQVPKIEVPEIPKIEVPKIEVPEAKIPKIEVPEIPKIEVPKIEVPEAKIPKIEVPEIKLPNLSDYFTIENFLKKHPGFLSQINTFANSPAFKDVYSNLPKAFDSKFQSLKDVLKNTNKEVTSTNTEPKIKNESLLEPQETNHPSQEFIVQQFSQSSLEQLQKILPNLFQKGTYEIFNKLNATLEKQKEDKPKNEFWSEREKKIGSFILNPFKKLFEKKDEKVEKPKPEVKEEEPKNLLQPTTELEKLEPKDQSVLFDGFTQDGLSELQHELPEIIKNGTKDLLENLTKNNDNLQKSFNDLKQTIGQSGGGILGSALTMAEGAGAAAAGKGIFDKIKSFFKKGVGAGAEAGEAAAAGEAGVAGEAAVGAETAAGAAGATEAGAAGAAGAGAAATGAVVVGGLALGSVIGEGINRAIYGKEKMKEVHDELGGGITSMGVLGFGKGIYGLGKQFVEGAMQKDEFAKQNQENLERSNKKAQDLGFKDQAEQLQMIKSGQVKPGKSKDTSIKPTEEVSKVEPTKTEPTTSTNPETKKEISAEEKSNTYKEVLDKQYGKGKGINVTPLQETNPVTPQDQTPVITPQDNTPKIETGEATTTDKSAEHLSKLVDKTDTTNDKLDNLLNGFNILANVMSNFGDKVVENAGSTTVINTSNNKAAPQKTITASEATRNGNPAISMTRVNQVERDRSKFYKPQ